MYHLFLILLQSQSTKDQNATDNKTLTTISKTTIMTIKYFIQYLCKKTGVSLNQT
jgi:hypothetical protein